MSYGNEGTQVSPEERRLYGRYQRPLPDDALEYLPATKWEKVSPEERRRRRQELNQKIKDGVTSIQRSPEFREYLIAMSRFHTYSWHNQILIMIQRPDATFVKGFLGWKEMGRTVKKGETGIRILRPSGPASDEQWTRVTDRATWEIRRVNTEWGVYQNGQLVNRFRTRGKAAQWLRDQGAVAHRRVIDVERFVDTTVFDIKQTEGKPLPEFVVPVLTGEMNRELYNSVLALMKKRGVTVSFESRPHQDPGIKGQFSPPNQIWVRPEEPPAQQLKTLLHESAHYYSTGVFRIPREDAETIAESAAYAVGVHYGFDTGVRSFPYVALWARDEETLKKNLDAIHNVTEHILDELEESLGKLPFEEPARPPAPPLPPEPPKEPLRPPSPPPPPVPPKEPTIPKTRREQIMEFDFAYTMDELKKMAKEKGVSPSGTKREIIDRLI